MPYANALLMVIKEVSKAIADMFGIKLVDYNSGIASSEDAFVDLGDSVDGTIGKVKELKRQTLGFDEIHNINGDNDSGSGASVTGGIDQRLLDAIHGYDNGMDKVRMKATEIRDRIMEWLGFTKEIDPLTGEVKFKYQGIKTTLKNIWNSFIGLSTQGKILVGLGLYTLINNLFSGTKKLATSLGTGTGLLGVINKLLSPIKSLYKSLDDVNYYNKSLTKGLSEGITNWKQSLTMADKFKVSLVGILGLSASMNGMASAMKSVSNEGWNLGNSLQTVVSGLGGIASGAMMGGAWVGTWGAIIGGATGAVLELKSAISGYQTETDKMIEKSEKVRTSVNDYLSSLKEQNIAIEENLTSNLALTGAHQNLISELKTLVDENGKVKAGYEDRANYILTVLSQAYGVEYQLVDGQIQNYKNLTSSIEESIRLKQAEILLDANKQKYANALQNELKLWKEKENAQRELNKFLEEEKRLQGIINKILPSGNVLDLKVSDTNLYNNTIKSLENVRTEIQKWQVTFDQATEDYKENIYTQTAYSDLQEAILTGNMEDIESKTKEFTNSYISEGERVTASISDQIKKSFEDKEIILQNEQHYSDEKQKIRENSANATIQSVIDELLGMSKTVDDLSPEVIEAWGTLAQSNEEEFMKNFSKLPDDVKTQVVDKMNVQGLNISKELQNGLDQWKPTITVNADTSNARWQMNDLISTIQSQLQNPFSIIAGLRANGGVYSGGSWKDIPQYSNGGAPSHGTVFVGGENGPEIAGHINGRTEILNQSQIASSIYSAVVNAMTQVMSQYGGQASEIDVHVHSDEGVLIDRIEQRTKQTGQFPFTIPTY